MPLPRHVRSAVTLVAAASLASCAARPAAAPPTEVRPVSASSAPAQAAPPPADQDGLAVPDGLGPAVLDRIPGGSRQLLVVTGDAEGSWRSTAVLWRRDAAGRWHPGPAWVAHNARLGWTEHHREGDLRSPEGVWTLSDAGGRLPDPRPHGGLPYHRSDAFATSGTGFLGEPLTGSFDYVVAIDYNRVRGTSPMDGARPQGGALGGGIWLHVDHGGPTHACVGLSKSDMASLIRQLDPAAHPVVAMGTRAFLARG
ncbi:L,D-transpeptidase family protein [Peterkaempfera griseoplana]|uniref:L,D-transpeptidase family protein n=1 Tax=Peterkaempfera griseoplana TaxID=66896 RepID=UPI0006E46041|nr:L,D-transpeptidase family protein [Peterkaempfera griseoplana]